jgi:hypothetical protein
VERPPSELRGLLRWAIQGTAGEGRPEVLAVALAASVEVARLAVPLWRSVRPDDARVPDALAVAQVVLAGRDTEEHARAAMDAAVDAADAEDDPALAAAARAVASAAGVAGGFPGELADGIEAAVQALAGTTSEAGATARVHAAVCAALGSSRDARR